MLHSALVVLFFLLICAFSGLLIFSIVNKILLVARNKDDTKSRKGIIARIDSFIKGSDVNFKEDLDSYYASAANRGNDFLKALDSYLLSVLENPGGKDRSRYIAIANRFNFPADSLAQIRSGNVRMIALGSRRAGLYLCQEAVADMINALDILSSENQFEILMGLARIGIADNMQRAFEKINKNILVNERAVIGILGAFPEGKEKKNLFHNIISGNFDYVKALFLKAMDREMARKMKNELIAVLRSGNNEIRISAIRGIAALGEEAPAEILIQALKDNDWEVRALAAKALGQVKTSESSTALYNALFDHQWWIRQNAANSLLGHPGYETLFVLAAESGDEYTKDSIVSVLENGNNPVLLRAIKRITA